MVLYEEKDKSIPQKATIIVLELLLLWLSYWILFQNGGYKILYRLRIEDVSASVERRTIIFVFSIIVFLRIGFMMTYLLKRKIPWKESFGIAFAFALYYVGFAFFVLTTPQSLDFIDFTGILIFIAGSFINTYSEVQRHLWKIKDENRRKIYTDGLFRYSMHINYFGDLLWVLGYTIVTRNVYALAIPIFLFLFFNNYNIPKLEIHLSRRYGKQFYDYEKDTKRLIPFIY
jgi:protein-S-isoprenylcysteine O-methyltransferase Ste14